MQVWRAKNLPKSSASRHHFHQTKRQQREQVQRPTMLRCVRAASVRLVARASRQATRQSATCEQIIQPRIRISRCIRYRFFGYSYGDEHRRRDRPRKHGDEIDDRFQSGVVPEAKGFKGSMKCYHFVGSCGDKATAERSGPLDVRYSFCACPPCRAKSYSHCEQKRNCGSMRKIYTPLVQKVRGAQSMTAQLEKFAATLHARQLLAVRTPENSFWLARTMGRAYEAEEDFIHSGNTIEAGWLVVNIKWYEKCDDHYVLAGEELPLIVNTAIRVGGLGWERVHNGKYYISRESIERIESSI